MMNISKQQARDRWDTLPDNLKEAIFSEVNADIVWRVGEANHLNEGKIREIATVAGDVVMGFLHPDPDDVSREIQARINIPRPLALDIAKELARKIFLPLKNDLDRIYSPVGSETLTRPLESVIPVEITETKPESPREPQRAEAPPDLPLAESVPETEPTAPPVNEVKKEPPAVGEDQPFILHEEKPLFTPVVPPEKPYVSFEPPRSPKAPAPKKVTVKIETPQEKSEEARVVHYSNLRTPLDTDAKDAK